MAALTSGIGLGCYEYPRAGRYQRNVAWECAASPPRGRLSGLFGTTAEASTNERHRVRTGWRGSGRMPPARLMLADLELQPFDRPCRAQLSHLGLLHEHSLCTRANAARSAAFRTSPPSIFMIAARSSHSSRRCSGHLASSRHQRGSSASPSRIHVRTSAPPCSIALGSSQYGRQHLARAPKAFCHQAAACAPAGSASNATSTRDAKASRPTQRSHRPPVVLPAATTATRSAASWAIATASSTPPTSIAGAFGRRVSTRYSALPPPLTETYLLCFGAWSPTLRMTTRHSSCPTHQGKTIPRGSQRRLLGLEPAPRPQISRGTRRSAG